MTYRALRANSSAKRALAGETRLIELCRAE
jgi:hypothetical protein